MVFLELLKDVERGVYPLNSRLPTESALCERFKVSRNTVRNAIASLVDENKVEFKKNSGARVTSPPKEKLHLDTVSIMLPTVNELLSEIQNLVLSKEYIPNFFFHCSHSWDSLVEERFLAQVLKQRHKVLLAFCSPGRELETAAVLEQLIYDGIRVIHMDIFKSSLPNEEYCIPDYKRAGRAAATSLMIAGYENLYYCDYEDMGPIDPLLLEGFLEVVGDQSSVQIEKRDIFKYEEDANCFQLREFGSCDLEKKFDLFLSKLKKGSGIVCGNKSRAKKLIKLFKSHGINVPEDVGVIGVEMMHEYNSDEKDLDCVVFNRLRAFQSVIEIVTQENSEEIKELLIPEIIHNGTI